MKSKVRFDGLDVAAMVATWNRVALGRRVINIYDGPNGDTYLFKLDKQQGEESNLLLIVESGMRFHSTQQSFENPGMPSPFCSKMRKHLRGLRLENVQQLGKMDRVVNLVFGSGEKQRHSLILEFYARGNIILTNSQYQILSLLRSHEYDNVKVKVGHAYPVTYATTMTAIEEDNTNEPQDNTDTKLQQTQKSSFLNATDPMEWYQQYHQQQNPEQQQPDGNNSNSKKKKKGEGNVWKNIMLKQESGLSHYGPSLIDHCLLCADIGSKQPKDLEKSEWTQLQTIVKDEGNAVLKKLDAVDTKGYIFYKPKERNTQSDNDKSAAAAATAGANTPRSPFEDKILLEFQPHVLKQHETVLNMECDTFDGAVDAFFSHIESQKRMMGAERQQTQAQQRLEKIRKDQKQRVQNLETQQEVLKQQAQLVEMHADMVEKAIQVVNSALDSGMDWDQLDNLVQIEKVQNQNPVAMLIHKLDLENDIMVLRLEREAATIVEKDSKENDENARTMDVTISLKDTAHGNASALFAKYRASKEKSQKTIEASTKALQAAEESAQRQLLEAQKRKSNLTHTLHVKRKPLWFEKFNWFITSDNYLVLGGRDAQQNEQIVKRYLRPGDAYLHADVHGAASCVLRAKRKREQNGKTTILPLSDQALREAGNFTICRSSAWTSRMVTSAWWVESQQVSKTAPTGEYLTVGSFMIRGKKNFLPPTQLEMGLGVLFFLGDDEAIARHKNERRDFALMQMVNEDSTEVEMPLERPKSKAYNLPVAEEKKMDVIDEKINKEKARSESTRGKGGVSQSMDNEKSKVEDPKSVEGTAPLENGQPKKEDPKPSPAPSAKTKKGMSVKERKLIRKYGSLEAAKAAEEERQKAEEARKKEANVAPSVAKDNTDVPPTNYKRGRKSKMKRMAKKYADQDEEDRELAMLALHAGEKLKMIGRKKEPEINETEKEAAAQTVAILKKDASVVAERFPEEVRNILAKCVTVVNGEDTIVRWDKFDADVLEQLESFDLLEEQIAAANRLLGLKESTRIDNFSASLAGIIRTIKKFGHRGLAKEETTNDDGKRKTKAEKEAEEKSWKQTLAEEGIVEDDSEIDAVDDTVELSKLTGKPLNEDLILFAVPVCAPYQTLSKYAYRVKLTPGSMKRGKASKQCITMYLKDGQKSAFVDRNKDLIRKVADNEWVSAICGDVKISAAGASKAMKNQKSKSKARNKK